MSGLPISKMHVHTEDKRIREIFKRSPESIRQRRTVGHIIADALMLGIWSIQYEAKRRGNISVLPTFHSKEQPTSVKGFSLIELLIVVAIILIIAAIAIPNLLRSRMAANEASAVGSIRTINTAAITYNSVYGNGFPPSLASMGTTGSSAVSCTNAELLDSVVTGGTKSGYTFALVHGSTILTSAASSCSGGYGYADGYVATATPVTVGTTGQRAFCSDATGVIRFSASGTATTATPYCSSTMNPLQ